MSVHTVFGQQCGVGAGLDHLAFVEHHDAISMLHGAQAVGNDERGAPLLQGLQGLLDMPL